MKHLKEPMICKAICVFLLVSGITLAQRVRYDGFRLISITPQNGEQLRYLAGLESGDDGDDIDFWSHAREVNQSVVALVSASAFSKYAKRMTFKVTVDDVQRVIDAEESALRRRAARSERIVGYYADFDKINGYLEEIERKNSFAKVYVPGKSFERRNISVLRLNTGNTKRSIWFDCGIHAREWISPSTCIWIIDRLVDGYNSRNETVVDLLNYYDVHVMPVHNPDGYVHSLTRDRFWRKNRARNWGTACTGVDLNRNYGYQWYTGGSSDNPCSDTYAGPYSNSELETMALQNAMLTLRNRWDAYVSFHSYGQYFFTPFAYTTRPSPHYDEQMRVANLTRKAIKSVYGTDYKTGSVANLLYIASGCSQDWAYGELGVVHSYTIELRPSINDVNVGFLLPESNAPFVGEEMYQGMLTLMKMIKLSSK